MRLPSLARYFDLSELPSDPPPAPPAPRPADAGAANVQCEFCGCLLDREGAVLRRGEAARRMVGIEDKLAAAIAERDTVARERDQLRAQLDALTKPADAGGAMRFRVFKDAE